MGGSGNSRFLLGTVGRHQSDTLSRGTLYAASDRADTATDVGGRSSVTLPRGVRNNNPGNIVDLGRLGPWEGQTGRDRNFAVFRTPEAGLRALGVNTISHQRLHGANTVEEIITRHAPASENNSRRYSQFVANELGVRPTDRIDTQDTNTLSRLMRAIITYENGAAVANRYTREQLDNAAEAAVTHHRRRRNQ